MICNCKDIYKKLPPILLLIHLVVGFLYCMYVTWYTDTLGGDTLEHIHSSWLVYANFIPYKDFFQHHNPLLWYIFAPFVGLHAKGLDSNIIVASTISSAIIISFVNYYYLYLITSRFFSTKLSGIISASIAYTPYMVLSIIHFRPDNFMMTSFFAGLYYYFCYIKDKKIWQLSLSFLLFWASFMFLQKIIFTLALIGIITLYLLYKKTIRLQDFMYAILLPITLSLLFVAYLYYNDILLVYYHSNFTFNLHIPTLFDGRRIGFIWPELKLLILGSVLSIIFMLKKSNIYFKILAVIFVFELVQRITYFSAFAYYFFLLVYTSSILTATFLTEKVFSRWYWLIYVLIGALAFCMYEPKIYNGIIGKKIGHFYNPISRKVLQYSTPCDYMINGDGALYNLYNRDPHYYWNLLGQLDVIGAKVGINPLMDINYIIEKYKPKFISVAPYRDKYASERGVDIVVHRPNMELINKYYKPFDSSDIYILKPEYSKVKCDYDYSKRYYRAYN